MSGKSQKERMLAYLAQHAPARARDLKDIGISATTISRAVADGEIIRIGRGLYQLEDSEMDTHTALAEIAKRAPKAVICLVSALSFHGLTDQIPRKVWVAIGAKDWEPKIEYPRIRAVRFREPYFSQGVETHTISGVDVQVYSAPKSIADAFRNRNLVDRSVAIECMKSALENRKASPGILAAAAQENGAWKQMKPYLEALTSNG
jgi:predicted transcriptional regulator of viral defense system